MRPLNVNAENVLASRETEINSTGLENGVILSQANAFKRSNISRSTENIETVLGRCENVSQEARKASVQGDIMVIFPEMETGCTGNLGCLGIGMSEIDTNNGGTEVVSQFDIGETLFDNSREVTKIGLDVNSVNSNALSPHRMCRFLPDTRSVNIAESTDASNSENSLNSFDLELVNILENLNEGVALSLRRIRIVLSHFPIFNRVTNRF